jgi:LPXTG-motif cell wall-anchored protein
VVASCRKPGFAFGGTAPQAGTSPVLWLVIMAGGALLAAAGYLLRRVGRQARHAR